MFQTAYHSVVGSAGAGNQSETSPSVSGRSHAPGSIRAAAQSLISRFGAFAPFNAALEAERCAACGETECEREWLHVMDMAADLLRSGKADLLPGWRHRAR